MRALLSPVVLRNFRALFILQAGNYLIPLLLVPYLVRVLGLEVYGSWMFALSFVIMARICISYGFDLTATRQVAAFAQGSQRRLSELVTDVIAIRLSVWGGCLVLLMMLSLAVVQVADVRDLIFVAFFILLGEALFPVWLFQGMETMGAITQLRLGAKLANLVLVVVFVRGPEDLLFVPIFESATMMSAGVIALVIAQRRFSLQIVSPKLERIKTQLRNGGPVFVATLAAQFYTTVNMIVLGFMVGPLAVGAYALAEKIYSALRGIMGPFVQAVFPAMARLHDAAHSEFKETYRSVLRLLLPILCVVGVLLFLVAGPLVELVSGGQDNATINSLRIFALAFPFALGSFLAPMLVVRGQNTALMHITIVCGLSGLLLAPILTYFFDAPGTAGAFLIVQIYNSWALIQANRSIVRS